MQTNLDRSIPSSFSTSNSLNFLLKLFFSFIIPVYNRPNEILELLESFSKQESILEYEIVIIEDGSTISSKQVVDNFKSHASHSIANVDFRASVALPHSATTPVEI